MRLRFVVVCSSGEETIMESVDVLREASFPGRGELPRVFDPSSMLLALSM